MSGLLTSIILLFPLKLLGAEQSPEQVQQPELSDSLDYIDAPRNYLSGKIISFATDIDRFFGDQAVLTYANRFVISHRFPGAYPLDQAAALPFPVTGREDVQLGTDNLFGTL